MGEEDARVDREFWSHMSPGERVLETCALRAFGAPLQDALGRPRDLAHLELLGERA